MIIKTSLLGSAGGGRPFTTMMMTMMMIANVIIMESLVGSLVAGYGCLPLRTIPRLRGQVRRGETRRWKEILGDDGTCNFRVPVLGFVTHSGKSGGIVRAAQEQVVWFQIMCTTIVISEPFCRNIDGLGGWYTMAIGLRLRHTVYRTSRIRFGEGNGMALTRISGVIFLKVGIIVAHVLVMIFSSFRTAQVSTRCREGYFGRVSRSTLRGHTSVHRRLVIRLPVG
jgi:hypothetical protein